MRMEGCARRSILMGCNRRSVHRGILLERCAQKSALKGVRIEEYTKKGAHGGVGCTSRQGVRKEECARRSMHTGCNQRSAPGKVRTEECAVRSAHEGVRTVFDTSSLNSGHPTTRERKIKHKPQFVGLFVCLFFLHFAFTVNNVAVV